MRRLVLTTAFIATLLGAGLANAELVQRGDLRLSFSGRIAPQELPRDRVAPISFELGGSILTADGSRPPELRRIAVAFNRFGRVSTAGLPTCEPGQLQSTSTDLALALCRGALVGRGSFEANVDFENVAAFPFGGRVLAFNSVQGGRPALLVHIYGSVPVKATIVLSFKISHPAEGRFGTVFTADIPAIASNLGYVTDISLRFDRKYRHAGRTLSFLSARCAAPAGFRGAPFALARGSFLFADGQELDATLNRTCRVR